MSSTTAGLRLHKFITKTDIAVQKQQKYQTIFDRCTEHDGNTSIEGGKHGEHNST